MPTTRGGGDTVREVLSLDEVRAVTAYTVACAAQTIVLADKVAPDDPRPRAALSAARAFAEGGPRMRLLRTAAGDAHRAAAEAADQAAAHAASAAARAAASAYLRSDPTQTQLGHILGPGVYAARAAELARGGDRVVAEYVISAAADRATTVVLKVLRRYPRARNGRSRIADLMVRLDGLLRDPRPTPRVVDDPGPFFHGTRADLRPGDLLTPGWRSNYGSRRVANHLYVTASREGAPLAAELAHGDGPGRVYRVEPVGTLQDDPNVTDKRFPGNPTRSYRTTEPVRVLEEVLGWEPPSAELVAHLRQAMGGLAELGIEAMD